MNMNNESHPNRAKKTQAQDAKEKEGTHLKTLSIVHLAGDQDAIANALFSAAYEDKDEVLNELLSLSPSCLNKNKSNLVHWQEKDSGRTAIWYAAYGGSNKCLSILLDHCNRVQFINESSESSSTSSSSSLSSSSSSLSSSYSSRNSTDDIHNKEELCKCIVDLPSTCGTPPLLIASMMNHSKSVSLLLSVGSAFPNITNSHGTTAALLASYYGHDTILKILLQHDADINLSNEMGMTPLLASAKNGHLNTFLLAVQHGANLNHIMKDGTDCIMIAAIHNQGEIIQYISSLEPQSSSSSTLLDFNYRHQSTHNTPIHYAIQHDNLDSCIALIQSPHTDLTICNNDGQTIFHIAVQYQSTQVLQHCLCHSKYSKKTQSIINLKNTKTHQTPIMDAIKLGYTNVLQWIAPISDDDNIPLFTAVIKNDLKVTRALLQYSNIDINSKNDDGHTPLIVAVTLRFLEMCELLIQDGNADINIKTKKGGQTALQKAKKRNFDDIIKLLQSHGAT